MKKLLIFFVMIMTAMNQSMGNNTLTQRQLHLATLASLEAQGDLERLVPAINDALDDGVTVNEIKEAFSQLYAYTGFPRSLNALGTLAEVLDVRKAEGKKNNEGKDWKRPKVWDDAELALKMGTETQTKLSGKPFNYDFCPQDDYYLKAHLFGDIFAGDQLSASDREIVTVAALASLKGVVPQLASHQKGAVRMGNTPEQIDELMEYLSDNGLSLCDNAADATAGAWPKGNPNTAYAKYFIGDSHLAGIAPKNLKEGEKSVLPMSNVTLTEAEPSSVAVDDM